MGSPVLLGSSSRRSSCVVRRQRCERPWSCSLLPQRWPKLVGQRCRTSLVCSSASSDSSGTGGSLGAPQPSTSGTADVQREVLATEQLNNVPAGSSSSSAASTVGSSSTSSADGGISAKSVSKPEGSGAPSSDPGNPVTSLLAKLFLALSKALASAASLLQQFPAWVQAQHLKRLRDQSDEDPKDADKHAAFLAELNKSSPREVIVRVESRQYASNAQVVVEYMKALVSTGKLSEYAQSSSVASLQADHKSLTQLLKELQSAVAGEHPDDAPGASIRRPLHVTLHGSTLTTAQRAPSGPLQMVWSLLSTVLLIVVLAFAWLVGSQAVRRVQASNSLPAVAATSTSAQASSSGLGSGNGNSPAVDPKEYKKEELPEKSIRSFKDVKGCDEAKEELKEVVEFLKNPSRFTRLGAKLPKGVLLTGPPGTGKTLLAKAVAGEAGVPFFYRAGSEFEELYVGVGSRRMRALFAAAKKKAPCIVFIDEIDAIGGNRKHWENHTRKTLNQLLVEMDGFESNEGIIVMAATNLAESLDPALKRPGRFDRQVAVPLPDVKGRKDILDYYLSDKPIAQDVDRDLLSRQTQGFSGADLSNLVNEAAIVAAKENCDSISARMFDYAFDKILMGVERKSVRRTQEARRHTAFHEAGHALVALYTPGASPIHKATIVPRGHALGMVTQVGRDDEFSINRQQMQARIMVCMGGTVAEELIFGRDEVSSGATDDLRQANSMARHMVSECGLSDVIGPLYIDDRHCSEQLKQRVDDEVTKMLVEAKEKVKALLTDRNEDLHRLANALLERETLTREEIDMVLKGYQPPSQPAQGPGGGGGGDGSVGGSEPRGELGVAVVTAAAQPEEPGHAAGKPGQQQQQQQS